jgi:hypothetical protein
MSSNTQQTASSPGPRRPIEHQDDLAALAKSSRSGTVADQPTASRSKSVGQISTIVNQNLLVRANTQSATSNSLLHEPEYPARSVTLCVGKSHRPFELASNQLMTVSPYFRKALAEQQGHKGSFRSPEADTFSDIEESAMILFSQWLGRGTKLTGPHDFRSLHHYIALFVLAHKFEIEVLQNEGKLRYFICRSMTLNTSSHGHGPTLLRLTRHDSSCIQNRIHLCVHSRKQPHALLSGFNSGVLRISRSVEKHARTSDGCSPRASDQ